MTDHMTRTPPNSTPRQGRFRHGGLVAGLCAMGVLMTPGLTLAQEQTRQVETQRLMQTNDDMKIPYAGTVRASDMAGLSYEARGCIVAVSEDAKRARTAKAGQVLVELDDARMQLALRTVEARLLDLEAAIEERQLSIDAAMADDRRRQQELDFVSKEFERNSTMFRRGLINETTMEAVERRMMDAKFAAERAEETVTNANSAKKRAEIALEIGKLDLQSAEIDQSKMTVTAPFDGVLVGFEANVGDCVQEGGLSAQIYAPHMKAVDIYVLISSLSATGETSVAIGAPVKISRVNGQTCGGTITRMDTEADLESQYVKTTIDVDESCAPALFLNEAVEVLAGEDAMDAAYTVPNTAIIGGNSVFLVAEDDQRLMKVEAEIVMRGDDSSLIVLPNAEGSLLVRDGSAPLEDGQIVDVQEPT